MLSFGNGGQEPSSIPRGRPSRVVRVTARGHLRRLWFVGADGQAHLQTEVACGGLKDAGLCSVDVRASLRRTPYLACMTRRLLSARPARVLVLGLGGGLLPAALREAGVGHVTVLESSAEVIRLARTFFGVPADPSDGLAVHCLSAEDAIFGGALGRGAFDACAIDIWEGRSGTPGGTPTPHLEHVC